MLLRWRSSDPGLGFAVQVLRGAIQREALCSNTRCPRAGWLVSAGSALLRVLRPSLHPRALGPASASRGAGGEKHRHSQPQPRPHGGKELSTHPRTDTSGRSPSLWGRQPVGKPNAHFDTLLEGECRLVHVRSPGGRSLGGSGCRNSSGAGVEVREGACPPSQGLTCGWGCPSLPRPTWGGPFSCPVPSSARLTGGVGS